jgi:hypothetical protein
VPPLRLLAVLKGAYGLSEAPRLWYLEARRRLLELGFQELRLARSTFTLREDDKLVGMLTLHVDDGTLYGDKKSSTVREARKKLDKIFNIKEWHDLTKSADYLGAQWKQSKDGKYITVNMSKYITALQTTEVDRKRKDEDILSDEETTAHRSALMKLAWPVRHVLPQLSYSVSFLASKVTEATVSDMKHLNSIVKEAKSADAQGQALIRFTPLDLDNLLVVTPFDASFAKEEGMKSQSGFMSLLTDRRILEGRAPAALVEFQSARISRVVKSTMSAESASLSLALDRQLYLRLLVEAFIWGEPDTTGNWRHNLKLPGIMVTDARSLYDHLCTTGSMPSERQTLIDLLIARDLTEAKAMEIRWVPTTHMLADALTKSMKLSDVIVQ